MELIHAASYLALISAILNVVLAIGIYIRAANNKANKTFIILALIAAVWAIINFVYLRFQVYWGVQLSYFVGAYIPLLIFIWVQKFCQQYISKIFIWLFVILTIIISITALLPNFVKRDQFIFTSLGYKFIPGPLFILFIIVIPVICCVAFWIFLKHWKKTVGLQRIQDNYIFFGIVVPTSIVIVIDFVLPLFKVYNLATFDSMMSLVFVSIIGYSITRYRFLDIKVVIKKGLVHFVTIAIVLFLYVYLLIFGQRILVQQYSWSEQATTIWLVLVIVLTLEPMRRLILKSVDLVFYPQKEGEADQQNIALVLSTAQKLETLVTHLRKELGIIAGVSDVWFQLNDRKLGSLVGYPDGVGNYKIKASDELARRLSDDTGVIVFDELPYQQEEVDPIEADRLRQVSKQMKNLRASLAIPVGEKGDLIGAFFFGQKAGKEAYTSDVIKKLQDLQRPVTAALANALFYKQAVERITSIHQK